MMNGLMAPPGDEHAVSDACTRSIDRLFRGRCGGGLGWRRRFGARKAKHDPGSGVVGIALDGHVELEI
jgi:hypothetical protein